MPDLDELYQQVILDHNETPRNFGKLEGANRTAEGYNPVCGDHISVSLQMEDDVIRNIRFQGSGCAISKASASIMTASVKGKTRADAGVLFERFHEMVTGELDTHLDPHDLGKLAVFAGVRKFPARVKCATLAWHTLRAALDGNQGTATME
jgi:nitrogen fixation NifU-like protein